MRKYRVVKEPWRSDPRTTLWRVQERVLGVWLNTPALSVGSPEEAQAIHQAMLKKHKRVVVKEWTE